MKLRHVLPIAFVSLGVATVHAQTALDLVARSGGNLRVDVSCADFWATPDTGLQLTIDGAVQPALGTNGVDAVGYTRHGNEYTTWVPTDVGYVVPPGVHHVELAAPGCTTAAQDVEVWPFLPRTVSGRLAISDHSLDGPVGAPNGGGVMVGAFTVGRPAHPGEQATFRTAYAYDPGTTTGGLLSVSWVHRSFVFASDLRFGTQSTSGIATSAGTNALGAVRVDSGTFTGSELVAGMTVRLGGRLRIQSNIDLEAGTGIGGELTMPTGGSSENSNLFAPNSPDGDWFVPLWAAVTIKPSCNWGVQALASYEVHPTASSESAVSVAAGLIWQPSAACSEAPGLAVR